MRGINYGHNLVAASYRAVVTNQLEDIWSAGYRILRVAHPTYNSSTATLDMCRDVVVRALDMGFIVHWGVTATRPTVTAANHATFSSYVTSVVAPWAQGLNHPRLKLSLGNEEELHLDGTTLTTLTFKTAVKNLATSVRSIYTAGSIEYATDAAQRAEWASEGLGDIDLIGFNLYYEWSPYGAFKGAFDQLSAAFSGRFYISEWGVYGGYPTAAAFGANAEDIFASNMSIRQGIVDSVDHCVFSYGDGAFGVPTDMWALSASAGHRKAWYRLTGARRYSARLYSGF